MNLPVPEFSTSPPALRPDLVPGADNHDAALDAAAQAGRIDLPPAGESAGEQQAAVDLDASIAAARAAAEDILLRHRLQAVVPVLVDPLEALRRLG